MISKTKQKILDEAYEAIKSINYTEAELLIRLASAMSGDVRQVGGGRSR